MFFWSFLTSLWTFFNNFEVFIPLPFLKPKRQDAAVIIRERTPDGSQMPEKDENAKDHALNACAADLIRAVHAKDETGVASAFKAAFEILESRPHEEYPHEDQE